MAKDKERYSLPELDYGYGDLEPNISEEQLRTHHDKHHQAYVKTANSILEKIEKARENDEDIDMRSTLKSLSFQVGGHVLHSLFWKNLSPKGGGQPEGKLKEAIEAEFGSFKRFKEEFSQAALSVEGSGWAALCFDQVSKRVLLMQIEKHNVNLYPGFALLLVLDMWEHAYYIDRKNAKAGFVDAFWNIIDWNAVEEKLKHVTEMS